MLMNRPLYFLAGVVIMLFCILSLSGSVFLSLLFTLLWLPFLAFVPLRHLFSFGLLGALAGYLYAMQKIGVEVIAGGLAVLTQYGDFLGKGTSMTVRGMAASENLGKALASPLGSTSISDMAGPWIINATLVAGWLGTVVIVVLLFRLGRDVELLNRGYGFFSRTRLGTLLFLGAMSTIVAFNDYQMSNYAGIVLLAFAMRMIRCRNEAESGARPLST